ncbi:MAG: Sulfhydrogenase 1 subunit delta [Candidatus Heimdallarchaeota archaeon LC_3]|nr:MAG: Sulfhydrogenase 1 subunit delta [Candidatus Heimdallarchaeota archaeon LC_3]
MKYIEITYWRLVQEEPKDETNLDIAIVEGSVSNNDENKELKKIRENAKIVIAIGACAHLGGVQGLRNIMNDNLVQKASYDDLSGIRAIPVKAIEDIIPVDYTIRGCPINKDEFGQILLSLIQGRQPHHWDQPVCNECKQNRNVCFFEKDKKNLFCETQLAVCLGPITEGGCGARCPTNGMPCDGCRGWTTDFHIDEQIKEMKGRGLSMEEIIMLMRRYSGGNTKQTNFLTGVVK